MSPLRLDTSIRVADVVVTQSWIRDPLRVERMTAFVREGGYFTPEHVGRFHEGERNQFAVAVLARFPDGRVFAHDGHHRGVSIVNGGREFFAFDERVVVEWDDVARYNETNRRVGWVTPLDLVTEVRLPDIMAFKAEALALPEDELEAFILANRHRYCEPRRLRTLADLGRCIREGGCGAR